MTSAVRATFVSFIATGFGFASWASRIPQVKSHLELSSSELGWLLLSIAAGSIPALLIAGSLVARFGSKQVNQVMALLFSAATLAVAGGYLAGVAVLVAPLIVLGFAYGAWDVAMNVQGAAVERRIGRSIMPRFHAGFSVGTVAGALVGTLMVALGVPVSVHLSAVAVAIAIVVPLAVRSFIADHDDFEPTKIDNRHTRRALSAWKEPRTLVIGVLVLAFTFAEGAGNDWIGVAVIGGYHSSAVLGTLVFSTFLAAMTIGRWFGPSMLDRFGRVAMVRTLSACAAAGLALFAIGPTAIGFAFMSTILWGAGTSLGFPVGMSAGADDPKLAASRVSVIASIGYCAFLAGPPSIGFAGSHLGVRHALGLVVPLVVMAGWLAPVVRQSDGRASQPRSSSQASTGAVTGG